MAENQNSQIDRELRRLALSGRMDEVRQALMERLEQSPNDAEAKAELQRLINGKPLRMTLSSEQRQQMDEQEALEELQRLITQHPESSLRHYRKSALESLLKKSDAILEKVKSTIPEEAVSHRRAIQQRLRQFSRNRTKRLVLKSSVATLALAGVSIIFYAFHLSAEKKYQNLHIALLNNNISAIKECRYAADTAFNRFFSKKISEEIDKADVLLYKQEKHLAALQQQLIAIANHPLKTDSLSEEEMNELKAALNALPYGGKKLKKDLDALVHQTQAERQSKIKTAAAIISRPIPNIPDITGVPADDVKALQSIIKQLQSRYDSDTALVKAYRFSDTQLKKIAKRINEAKAQLDTVQAIANTCNRLKKCKNYQEYSEALLSAPVSDYPTSSLFEQAKTHLPKQEDVHYHMQSPDEEYTSEVIHAAEESLVHKQPTFNDSNPATSDQIYEMEDLFTSPSLKNVVYAVTFTDGETWYTTRAPYVDDTNFLIVKRDIIDPNFSIQNSHRELQDDGSVKITRIDATGFYESLSLDRNTFFTNTHLPTLLTQVLNTKRGKHPMLAQAYVYHTLLELVENNQEPLRTGIITSASMKEDFDSFNKVLKKSGISLVSGCWLNNSPQVEKAEQLFSEWFKTHRGKNYADEAAHGFTKRFSVQSQFCGYVNESGNLVPCQRIKNKSSQFWYTDKEGTLRSSSGKLEGAMPFSPVFLEIRSTH